MKLITKPEELVVGRIYVHRNKATGNRGASKWGACDDAEYWLRTTDIIECEAPTAADFDRLIQESKA